MSGIDELIEQTSASEVLSHFGQPPPENSSGEHRMPCVFSTTCIDSSYGTLAVNLSDPAKRIYCHACGIRGNLLTLLWGLMKHAPPSGGKLRGEEFKEAVATLKEIAGGSGPVTPNPAATRSASAKTEQCTAEAERNVPLKNADNPRARELVTLYEQLIADPAQMHPAAAAYIRARPWLTPAVMQHWRMGYLPQSAKGLMRGRMVYGYFDEGDNVLSYFGRDPDFERKRADWERRGRPEKGKPIKHRFVKGFHRGLELYGQNGKLRLQNRELRESIAQLGLCIVEGPNDVIRLDGLGVGAVGLCSNRATDKQVAKIARFARQIAGGKVVLLPDTDAEGEEGCKELLWKLHQAEGITPKLAWSSGMFGGAFKDRQPESLSVEEWETICGKLS